MTRKLKPFLLCGSLSLILSGCALFGPSDPNEVDCKNLQSSCHSGRFGLIWKTVTSNGVEGDSVSGTYRWQSGRSGTSNSMSVAYLEVNSTLGPNLGVARRKGEFYEVRAADGRVYLAKDWQTLFDLMFPVKLPAQALIDWMESPKDTDLPDLPENWYWENRQGKYRIHFIEADTKGRIDLIPQHFE
jgi:outer membrane biogenesis lipoprotein LolB